MLVAFVKRVQRYDVFFIPPNISGYFFSEMLFSPNNPHNNAVAMGYESPNRYYFLSAAGVAGAASAGLASALAGVAFAGLASAAGLFCPAPKPGRLLGLVVGFSIPSMTELSVAAVGAT